MVNPESLVYTHSRYPSTPSNISSTTTHLPGTRSRRTSFTTAPFDPPHDTPLLVLPTSSAAVLGGVARLVAQWEASGDRRASVASPSASASTAFSRRVSGQFTGGSGSGSDSGSGSGSTRGGELAGVRPRPASSLGFAPATSTATSRTIQFAVNTTLTGTRSRTTRTTNSVTGSTTRAPTVSFSDAANRTHTHIHNHIYSGGGAGPVARTVHAAGVGVRVGGVSLSKRRPVSWDVKDTPAWTAAAAAAGMAWSHQAVSGVTTAAASATTTVPKTSPTIFSPMDSTIAYGMAPRPLSRTGHVTTRTTRAAAPPSSYRSRVAPSAATPPPAQRTQDGQRSRPVSHLRHRDDDEQSTTGGSQGGQRSPPVSRLGHRDDTEGEARRDALTTPRPRSAIQVPFPGVASAIFGSPSTPAVTPSPPARAGRGAVVATPTPAGTGVQLPTPPVSTSGSPPNTANVNSPDTRMSSRTATTNTANGAPHAGWTAIEAALRLRGTVPDGVILGMIEAVVHEVTGRGSGGASPMSACASTHGGADGSDAGRGDGGAVGGRDGRGGASESGTRRDASSDAGVGSTVSTGRRRWSIQADALIPVQ